MFLLSGTMWSCQPARHLTKEQYLLQKVDIERSKKDIAVRDLDNYVKQKPNKKIFGLLRFHLGLYNLADPNKPKGIHKWLRDIGEEPVVYNPAMVVKSMDELKRYVENKGYHFGKVSDSIILKDKMAKVIYRIDFGEPYIVRRITFGDTALIREPEIRSLILNDTASTVLHPGMRYDLDVLQAERRRIAGVLKNQGYYNFSREYIYFRADTLIGNYGVDLSLGIMEPRNPEATPTEPVGHPRYKIGDIHVMPNYDPTAYLKNPNRYVAGSDSLNYDGIEIIFTDRSPIKPSLLFSSIYFSKGELYNQKKVDQTMESFSSLRNFRQININFTPGETRIDSMPTLDCKVFLSPVIRQKYEIALEGTHSSGNIGVAGNLIYKHRNLFRGAEDIEVKLKGAVEFLTNAVADFNRMVEFGVETRLDMPRAWIPFATAVQIQQYNPRSMLSVTYNYQQRPDFTRTIANAGFGYNWKSSTLALHRLNLADINYVNVSDISPTFYNVIKGTYIENSFRSHVVTALNYTLTLTDQEVDKPKNFFFLRVRPEVAGNTLSLFNRFAGRERPEPGFLLFGTPYSQYAMAEMDFRYNWVFNPYNRLAIRLFAGAGVPYGNATALPFEKKYFSGGSNGIRAWQVRSIGPGTYVLPDDQKRFYPNQLGDIKLEASLEYRFELFWKLEGALFIDAGNIWAIRQADDRPGALFSLASFYREFAIGTGLGVRLDLDFMLLRLDLGMKIRDPGTSDGPQWIPGYRRFGWSDFVWNFGIGYPF